MNNARILNPNGRDSPWLLLKADDNDFKATTKDIINYYV